MSRHIVGHQSTRQPPSYHHPSAEEDGNGVGRRSKSIVRSVKMMTVVSLSNNGLLTVQRIGNNNLPRRR